VLTGPSYPPRGPHTTMRQPNAAPARHIPSHVPFQQVRVIPRFLYSTLRRRLVAAAAAPHPGCPAPPLHAWDSRRLPPVRPGRRCPLIGCGSRQGRCDLWEKRCVLHTHTHTSSRDYVRVDTRRRGFASALPTPTGVPAVARRKPEQIRAFT